MKTRSFLTLVAALSIAVTVGIRAQSQTQSRGPEIHQKAAQRDNYFTGVVSDWIMNVKEYVYEGFYLQTETERLMVTFPASLANDIRRDVKVGNTISVKGIRGNDTLGVKRIRLISVIADGQPIPYNPGVVDDSVGVSEIVNGRAKIRDFQKDVNGTIHGYVLDNKTILRISPNTSEELRKALVKGADVTYSGIKSDAGSGEDAWSTYAVIICESITINNKQYLTR